MGEGDINDLDIVSAQRNPSSMLSPIQHHYLRLPLLPISSPLAMFDVSPFLIKIVGRGKPSLKFLHTNAHVCMMYDVYVGQRGC